MTTCSVKRTIKRPMSEAPKERIGIYGRARFIECRTAGRNSIVIETSSEELSAAIREAVAAYASREGVYPTTAVAI